MHPTRLTSSGGPFHTKRDGANETQGFGGGFAAGAGAFLSGSVLVRDSEFSGNTVGIQGGDTGNPVAAGGGLYVRSASTSRVINSTFSNNDANGADDRAIGAGIVAARESELSLNNNTVTDNMAVGTAAEGGGVAVAVGPVAMANNVIAGNTASDAPDCAALAFGGFGAGGFDSQGFNLIGDSTGCDFPGIAGDQVGTTASGPVDPMLAPRSDNGGPTQTHALLPGSPAIDAGNTDATPGSGFPACAEADQRGESRPTDGDGSGSAECDIGAFEGVVPAPTAADDTATTTAGEPVSIDVLANDNPASGSLDTASVTVASAPSDGTATVDSSGAVSYEPAEGFSGADSFTYTVADSSGATSDEASVTIKIVAASSGNGNGDGGGGGGGALSLPLLSVTLAAASLGLWRRFRGEALEP